MIPNVRWPKFACRAPSSSSPLISLLRFLLSSAMLSHAYTIHCPHGAFERILGLGFRLTLKFRLFISNHIMALSSRHPFSKARIQHIRQSSNPACGFSMMEQVRLCAVCATENCLGSSKKHITRWDVKCWRGCVYPKASRANSPGK